MFPVDSVIIISNYGQLTKFCHHASNATSDAYGCIAGLKLQKLRLPCKCIIGLSEPMLGSGSS